MIIRKNIFILSLVIIVLFVSACSSTSNGKNAVIGKWEDESSIVEFKKDGKLGTNDIWGSGEWYIDGDHLIISTSLLGKSEYVYDIKDNVLRLRYSNKSGVGAVAYKFTRFGTSKK